jgi:hypothetical protein
MCRGEAVGRAGGVAQGPRDEMILLVGVLQDDGEVEGGGEVAGGGQGTARDPGTAVRATDTNMI